ncbi:MAG: GNAT family protein [Planctomycetota bacterium]
MLSDHWQSVHETHHQAQTLQNNFQAHFCVGLGKQQNIEIATERLLLQPLETSDATALFGYRSLPEVSQYQSWIPNDVADAERFIASSTAHPFDTVGTWFQFGIRGFESGELLGDLGVHFPDGDRQQIELGITVAPAHQRRGIAGEALVATLRYAFQSLRKHRAYASVDPRNQASMALLQRIGMRQEAHFHQSVWCNGEWADDVIFAALATEWHAP